MEGIPALPDIPPSVLKAPVAQGRGFSLPSPLSGTIAEQMGQLARAPPISFPPILQRPAISQHTTERTLSSRRSNLRLDAFQPPRRWPRRSV
jgi:hypothetical protein